ncbi:MAG: hypothetical protein ACOYLB_01525 [Phototrophicaceae bacterium]
MRVEMEIRNLPLHRLQEYLREVGATQVEERRFLAEDWQAEIVAMEPAKIITMTVRRDLIVIEGADEAVQAIHDFMRGKTMRGGG